MSNAEIQRKIAEIDREINKSVANTRLPSLSGKHAHFPTSSWVSTIVLGGLALFGQAIPMVDVYVREYGMYVLIIAIILGIFAIYRTVMWLAKKGSKPDANYLKATERVRELQQQRQALQDQLEKTP